MPETQLQSQLSPGPAGTTGAEPDANGVLQYHDASGKVLGPAVEPADSDQEPTPATQSVQPSTSAPVTTPQSTAKPAFNFNAPFSSTPTAASATPQPTAKPAFNFNAPFSSTPTTAPQAAPANKGVLAGVKRNTVDALTGLYHAFSDPATDQEKQELLNKIREQNTQGDKIPETLATNPTRATLALHRIVDAPADVLAQKSRDEVGVARDLINHHEYWKGGNLYLSGLADRVLSAVPVAGPMLNSIVERGEGALVPAIDKQGKDIPVADVPASKKDFSGAATDVAAITALEHTPAIARAGGDVVSKAAELVAKTPGKVVDAAKNTAEAIKPEWLTKRPETPAPQHGAPVRVESPLDSPTISKQLGGKDLSQEAVDTLRQHVGDKVEVGSNAKTKLMEAVQPVTKAISDTAEKMNATVKDAPKFTTSVAQDNVFGEGSLTSDIDKLKNELPPSVRKPLSEDIEAVMDDADKALNSQDAAEVLEHRRLLGNKIDWENVVKNPTTPAEAQNLARVKVYRALGDKIHSEIPETVELDKKLQPNLELRSHLTNRLGERVLDDPHAATTEAQSQAKLGAQKIENDLHNERVARNWKVLGPILKGALTGVGGATAYETIKHLFM